MAAHRFHGDERRFEVTADFIAARFPQARTAADVAGGQGMLARRLRKRHNIECDVVDPRGWVLRGVPSRAEEYRADMAGFYDVIIGLHPDAALREVVCSARVRPVVVVPCCNFWLRDTKLGRDELLDAIEQHHARYGACERVVLDFRGPHNQALVLSPASGTASTPPESGRELPVLRGRRRAYDPSVVTRRPAWREVRPLVARALGEAVDGAEPLVPARRSGMTWAARAQRTGAVVVKLRHGDRAYDKTQWCAAQLPGLGARGYPVPAILWHGMITSQWHVTVQNRFPGRPLFPLDGSLGGALDGPILDALLSLVELQADAPIPAGDRDFTGYVANVLFDDWDEVWADAPRACAAAGPLCARLRRWLEPVWGLRLPAADYAHNDLNLSNVLTDGSRITGVVDWDEFGLGSRALDLIALAFDCERCGDRAAAYRLLARAAEVAGGDGLRCLVSYRVIAGLAVFTRERRAYGHPLGDEECAATLAILDRLQAPEST